MGDKFLEQAKKFEGKRSPKDPGLDKMVKLPIDKKGEKKSK